MKYFKLIERSVDVALFLQEIQANPDAWTLDTERQNLKAQRDTETIILHSHGHDWIKDTKAQRRVPVSYVGRSTSNAALFLRTSAWVEEFIKRMNGRAGRVAIVRLKPHGQVNRHIDGWLYYDLRHRYHLVVKSARGSLVRAGDEEVRMKEGEIWWFDNQVLHEAINDSDEDRIHVIFDVLSLESMRYFFVHAILWRYPRRLLRRPVRALRNKMKRMGRLPSKQ